MKTKFVSSRNESKIKVGREIRKQETQSEMTGDKIYESLSNRDVAILNSAL